MDKEEEGNQGLSPINPDYRKVNRIKIMYGWEVASSFELCNYPFLSISMTNALAAALSTYSRDDRVLNCSQSFFYILVHLDVIPS